MTVLASVASQVALIRELEEKRNLTVIEQLALERLYDLERVRERQARYQKNSPKKYKANYTKYNSAHKRSENNG